MERRAITLSLLKEEGLSLSNVGVPSACENQRNLMKAVGGRDAYVPKL
jgi:hypothetical protein